MRLICDKCEAQYEVPADVIPPEGRDVQCSNCGHTWLQSPPDVLPDRPEPEIAGPEPDITGSDAEKTEDSTSTVVAPDLPPDAPEDPDDEEEDAQPAPRRRELDPDVAKVLRAEAELEVRARRSERVTVESQPDLGLPEGGRRAVRAAPSGTGLSDPIDLPGTAPDRAVEALAATASAATVPHRGQLPDIEEINSTLRSNSERAPDLDPGQTALLQRRERRGSRLGFWLTVALAALLMLTYTYAPEIAAKVPAAAQALDSYVTTVDGLRAWLDAQVAAVLTWLDSLSAAEN